MGTGGWCLAAKLSKIVKVSSGFIVWPEFFQQNFQPRVMIHSRLKVAGRVKIRNWLLDGNFYCLEGRGVGHVLGIRAGKTLGNRGA